jgi:hypothetical protein
LQIYYGGAVISDVDDPFRIMPSGVVTPKSAAIVLGDSVKYFCWISGDKKKSSGDMVMSMWKTSTKYFVLNVTAVNDSAVTAIATPTSSARYIVTCETKRKPSTIDFTYLYVERPLRLPKLTGAEVTTDAVLDPDNYDAHIKHVTYLKLWWNQQPSLATVDDEEDKETLVNMIITNRQYNITKSLDVKRRKKDSTVLQLSLSFSPPVPQIYSLDLNIAMKYTQFFVQNMKFSTNNLFDHRVRSHLTTNWFIQPEKIRRLTLPPGIEYIVTVDDDDKLCMLVGWMEQTNNTLFKITTQLLSRKEERTTTRLVYNNKTKLTTSFSREINETIGYKNLLPRIHHHAVLCPVLVRGVYNVSVHSANSDYAPSLEEPSWSPPSIRSYRVDDDKRTKRNIQQHSTIEERHKQRRNRATISLNKCYG